MHLDALGFEKLLHLGHHADGADAIEDFKKRARVGDPPVTVETGCAIVNGRRAAEKFLVEQIP
jgi:hypothetical protein